MRAPLLDLLIPIVLGAGLGIAPMRAQAQSEAAPALTSGASPSAGRYVEAPGYSPYAPGDPRAPDAPEPQGFRLNAKICAGAASQNDPLAQTAECQGILQAARDQAEACKRAFETGDDQVVLSAACRQAAMAR